MKSRIRIMGRLSVVLLICVLLGQGAWMYRVREMKVDEFRQTADYVLSDHCSKFYWIVKLLICY